jgi:hypothetical protein
LNNGLKKLINKEIPCKNKIKDQNPGVRNKMKNNHKLKRLTTVLELKIG